MKESQLNDILSVMIEKIESNEIKNTKVIPWSSPIPCFGSISKSRVATLGINPSNREFVDENGHELTGPFRRFHTLKSLSLSNWSKSGSLHRKMIGEKCENYFHNSPYDRWFRSLDSVISSTGFSYYGKRYSACHLDLIPYATYCKWTEINSTEKNFLKNYSGNDLAELVKESPIDLLILNGQTVVNELQLISGESLKKREMTRWDLYRKNGNNVKGYCYSGYIGKIGDLNLGRKIKVLGYNHNIQSSFGVTSEVKDSIKNWIGKSYK